MSVTSQSIQAIGLPADVGNGQSSCKDVSEFEPERQDVRNGESHPAPECSSPKVNGETPAAPTSNGDLDGHQNGHLLTEEEQEKSPAKELVNGENGVNGVTSPIVNGTSDSTQRSPVPDDERKDFGRARGQKVASKGRSSNPFRPHPRQGNGLFRGRAPEARFLPSAAAGAGPSAAFPNYLFQHTFQSPFSKQSVQASSIGLTSQPKPLEVETSKTNLYIRGLLPTHNDTYLRDLCSRYGPIKSTKAIIDKATGKCKGYGFVDFESSQVAHTALQGLLQLNMDVQLARLRQDTHDVRGPEDTTNLYLANLPLDMDDQGLQDLLASYGEIVSTRILHHQDSGESKGVGFCRMETREACQAVIDTFSGKVLPGQTVPLTVKFADAGRKRFLRDSPRAFPTRDGTLQLGGAAVQFDYQNRMPAQVYNHQAAPYLAANSLAPYQVAAAQYYGQQYVPMHSTALQQAHLHGAIPHTSQTTDMNGLTGQLAHLTVQMPPNAQVTQPYLAQLPNQFWSNLSTTQPHLVGVHSQPAVATSHSVLNPSQGVTVSQGMSSVSQPVAATAQGMAGLGLPQQAFLSHMSANEDQTTAQGYGQAMAMASVDDFGILSQQQLSAMMGSSASVLVPPSESATAALQAYNQ